MTFEFFIIIIAALIAFCGIMIVLWFRAEKRADFYKEEINAHLEITENVSKRMQKYGLTPDEFNQIYIGAEQQYLNKHYNNKQ